MPHRKSEAFGLVFRVFDVLKNQGFGSSRFQSLDFSNYQSFESPKEPPEPLTIIPVTNVTCYQCYFFRFACAKFHCLASSARRTRLTDVTMLLFPITTKTTSPSLKASIPISPRLIFEAPSECENHPKRPPLTTQKSPRFLSFPYLSSRHRPNIQKPFPMRKQATEDYKSPY